MALTFSTDIVPYALGRRANMEEWNTITRTKEGAGNLGFGVPVKPGSGAHTCVATTAADEAILGITEASQVLPHPGDYYSQYDNVAICEVGVIGVNLDDDVVAGAQARWNTATSKWTDAAQSGTVATIPGATFEVAGTGGTVGLIRYRRPNPSTSDVT